jgi:hypothetical protein
MYFACIVNVLCLQRKNVVAVYPLSDDNDDADLMQGLPKLQPGYL